MCHDGSITDGSSGFKKQYRAKSHKKGGRDRVVIIKKKSGLPSYSNLNIKRARLLYI